MTLLTQLGSLFPGNIAALAGDLILEALGSFEKNDALLRKLAKFTLWWERRHPGLEKFRLRLATAGISRNELNHAEDRIKAERAAKSSTTLTVLP
jgi:hypothetical protein